MSSERTVKNILASAGSLKSLVDSKQPVALREVQRLRAAFDKVMSSTPKYEFTKKAVQCDNLLTQLEAATRADPTALTGDLPDGAKRKEQWHFANIPKRRRMQTLAVSLFLFFTGIPFFLGLTYLLFTNWFTFPLMLIYGACIVFRPLRHPIPKWRPYVGHSLWRHYRDYFPIRLVLTKQTRQKFSRKKNYVFAYHPHGVQSFGALINFGSDINKTSELLPGIVVHIQTLRANFYIPFWRELFLFAGCGDASPACIRKTLRAGPGESVMLVVGGAEESLLSEPGTNNLTLVKRKGFVRLALECGASLVPVYAFGENSVYNNLATGRPRLQRLLQRLQKRIGFAIPLIHGRGYFNYHFGVLPHRRPIVVVVGPPLDLPKIENPTRADIDEWHRRYVAALVALFEEHRAIHDDLKSTDLHLV